MASAAMLDFVTTSYSTVLSITTSWMLLSGQIWWKSVEPFKSYSKILIFKMATAAILDFTENDNFNKMADFYSMKATFS